MVDINIVNEVYKPTYNWGAPSCKPPISMGHLYHGYVSHTQRVTIEHYGDFKSKNQWFGQQWDI